VCVLGFEFYVYICVSLDFSGRVLLTFAVLGLDS